MALINITRFAKLTADFPHSGDSTKAYDPELYNVLREITFMLGSLDIVAGTGITVSNNGGVITISAPPASGSSSSSSSSSVIPDWERLFLTMGS